MRWLGLRLPRRTIRLRLTLLYGCVFVVCGAALLTVTYLLVAHQYTDRFFVQSGREGMGPVVSRVSHSSTSASRRRPTAV